MPRIANVEREQEIITRYQNGESATDIAKGLHLSLAAIYKTLKRKNIDRTGSSTPVADEVKHDIVNRYLSGESAADIATACDLARSSVYRVIDEARVEKQRPRSK